MIPVFPGPWQDELANQDTIVNLAGVSIFSRWSKSKKKQFTKAGLIQPGIYRTCFPQIREKGIHLINASAAGYYGFHGDKTLPNLTLPEMISLPGSAWIGRKKPSGREEGGAKVTLTRFGIILGPGGALDILIHLFRFFLGSRLGDGPSISPGFTTKIFSPVFGIS